MKIEHLKGLIAAPFTPMHADGSLNLGMIPFYYETLRTNGVTGAFICGSTGEGVSLTLQEKKQVAEAWANATQNNKDFKVITLVGGTCIADCIDLSQHARSAGLFAVAMTAPFYFKPADVSVLADVCASVAETVPDLPFYYYHIPVLTGVNFPMIDFLRKVDNRIPNLAGIKYTHEDFMDFLSCLNFSAGKYDMLWGRDENFLSALVLGAQGAVGSTYNYAAPLYHELIEAYERGDVETARERQQRAIDMISLLGKYGGLGTGKAFMKLIGIDCGNFRPPVRNVSSSAFDLFAQDVARLSFERFCARLPAIANNPEK